MYLVVLIAEDLSKVEDVLDEWRKMGVPGVTVIEGRGVGKATFHGCDSIIASFEALFNANKDPNRILMAVVRGGSDRAEAVVSRAEEILGDLLQDNKGIAFWLPVSGEKGIHWPEHGPGPACEPKS
jgi:nitrogen regulatory protein PII